MKIKRSTLILGIVAGLFMVALLLPAISAARLKSARIKMFGAVRALPRQRLVSAIQAFSEDRRASGRPLPDSVPLEDLVSGGYLRAEEVRALKGIETIVSLHLDETQPSGVLLQARSPWEWIVLRLDGTVDVKRR
jgi:hypothetical protein